MRMRLFGSLLLVALVAGSCTNTTSQARRALCPDPSPIGTPDGELTDIATGSGPTSGLAATESGGEGTYLFYAANPTGEFQIYRIGPAGPSDESVRAADSPAARLTDSAKDQGSSNVTPFASRSGYVVFSSNRTGNYEIYIMRPDGSGQTRLTNTPGNEVGPVLSPDGRTLAFTSDCHGHEDVFVASVNGQSLKRITTAEGSDTAPDWSADGALIAYVSEVEGEKAIYLADPDGQNPRRLTRNSFAESAPAFSPDGKHIAFQAKRGRYWQIHVVSVDGTDERVISDGTANDSRPRWSHDGSRIYFVSDRDGHDAIYMVELEGSGPTRVVGDSHDARSPSEAILP